MLALPVERLVGNSSTSSSNTNSTKGDSTRSHRGQGLNHHTHHRPPTSTSPDSSTSAMSDCSTSSSPSSSPGKGHASTPSSPIFKSQSADLCNDIHSNRNNSNSNFHLISPSTSPHSGEVGRTSPDRSGVNSRKRRRSSISCESTSRSNSPNSAGSGHLGHNHDVSRKGMMVMIKQEDSSPRNSPQSCHSCCCQKEEDNPSSFPTRHGSNVPTKSSNETKIESEDMINECANNNSSMSNKINNRTSAHHFYHHHHEESHSVGDHHPHYHSRHHHQEEMREQSSRSKVNSRNHYNNGNNGGDNNESGGHPSLTVDNGLSSPGSISSNSSSNGRPPSRPPSTASTASSSCFSSVLSLSTSTTTSRSSLHNHYNHLHQNSHSHQLKFSIEDILRPDFGKVRMSHHLNGIKSPNAINNGMHHNHHHQNGASPTKKIHQQTHSSEARPSSRASSFKYHSEDSNDSSTSRHTEVVDETKINPSVPEGPLLWPAWVYCTRYSDRPSSGPRSRRIRKKETEPSEPEEKRPRTAFTAEQLSRLKQEFDENRYLTEKRRQDLALDLKLHENQIKIWFQNKRAKLKKSTGQRNGLAVQLMAQGLYNHSTVPVDEDEEMLLM